MTTLNAVFFLFILICSFTDISQRKVYNIVVFPSLLCGLTLNFLLSGLPGLAHSAAGVIVGFATLFFFFLSGGVGAGDVKFLMAAGGLKGWEFVLTGTIYGAVIAGIYAFFSSIVRGTLWKTVRDIYYLFFITFMLRQKTNINTNERYSIPYVLFLSMGMVLRAVENEIYRW